MAAPTAYGGSQARGLFGAVATGLCYSHRTLFIIVGNGNHLSAHKYFAAVKRLILEDLLWYGGLRIQYCHCNGLGCCVCRFSPWPRNFLVSFAPPKKKRILKNKQSMFLKYNDMKKFSGLSFRLRKVGI